MTYNNNDTAYNDTAYIDASAGASGSSDQPRQKPAPKKGQKNDPRKFIRLTPEEIALRDARQAPAIALTRPAVDLEEASGTGHPTHDVIGVGEQNSVRVPAAATLVRQPTLAEGCDDPAILAEWAALTILPEPEDQGDDDGACEGSSASTDSGTRHGSATARVTPVGSVGSAMDEAARRAGLSRLYTHDDPFLVEAVRPAVVDLVLEHRHVSVEADRHVVALGIRFGAWCLPRSADGTFNPYRDLTEDRIRGFVRAQSGLSEGTGASYATALRRLAAGPRLGPIGRRRAAVRPLAAFVVEGLWSAACDFADSDPLHCEAKSLLSLTLGAGAMPAECNLIAPGDVLVRTTRDPATGAVVERVSVRLTRDRHTGVMREVPVIEPRYAEWLADRSRQLAGHTWLVAPSRTSRRNAINATTKALTKANAAFERFRLPAARNTWAAGWLAAGIPFHVWAAAAGIGPGTHLPTDLLAYLPSPTPAQVEQALRQTPYQHPDQNPGQHSDHNPDQAPNHCPGPSRL